RGWPLRPQREIQRRGRRAAGPGADDGIARARAARPEQVALGAVFAFTPRAARRSGGDAAAQLHAHQVEARSVEAPRAAEQEERVMYLGVVRGRRRTIESIAILRERVCRAELVAVRFIKVGERFLEGHVR